MPDAARAVMDAMQAERSPTRRNPCFAIGQRLPLRRSKSPEIVEPTAAC